MFAGLMWSDAILQQIWPRLFSMPKDPKVLQKYPITIHHNSTYINVLLQANLVIISNYMFIHNSIYMDLNK